MASVINTNTLSMVTQQNLNQSQNALNTSMERLSSGLRINSAKDDAAGQAIANRMDSQITGLSQAQRNANDGISVAQTAEGALNQVNDNLQRVRELTVQAQNGTNNQDDLNSIQDEISMRLEEIDRISSQTSFNDIDILAKDQNLQIQVGANDGETISINLEEVTSSTLGLDNFNVSGPKGTPTAVTATEYKAAYGDTTSVTANTVAEETTGALATSLGVASGSVAISANAVKDDNGNWYAQVDITAASETEVNTLKSQGLDVENGTLKSFYISIDPQDADTTTSATDAAFTIDTSKLSTSSLSTGATDNPLDALDTALKDIDTQRSALGAVQNRFDSAISNLATTETNLASAQSRIQDADYAEEVSSMTTAQILQQAGTSMLTQANQVPQNVLSLLG
ncbi:FliC/FljB family flagellin [Cobetia marina]|uniref:FliC/FljB family flagellin n=1 Tax=Cobetia marina TaxID=28258 RepID=UPI0010AE805F|nr:FliC/FljB family flagellin [Cobetia marina]TKD63833.1 FliC/FljB family flagellin [Cobetia marina]